MARNDPQVNLRMPAILKDRLDAAAVQNKRSLTAEIMDRLEDSFEPNIPVTREMRRRIRATAPDRHWRTELMNMMQIWFPPLPPRRTYGEMPDIMEELADKMPNMRTFAGMDIEQIQGTLREGAMHIRQGIASGEIDPDELAPSENSEVDDPAIDE